MNTPVAALSAALAAAAALVAPAHAAFALGRLAAEPQLRSRRVVRQRQKLEREHSMGAASVAFRSLLADALASFEARRGRALSRSSAGESHPWGSDMGERAPA